MISDPRKILDLVTLNKDRNLGKFEREMSEAYFQDLLIRYIEDKLTKEQVTKMFDGMAEFLKQNEFNEDLSEKTNMEVHFVIQAASVIQYISPYNMDYNVGRTVKLIKENFVWALRPEAITLGYHNEYTNNKGRNHSLIEKNEHKDGTCKEFFNVIVLHTYEHYEPEGHKTSTFHVVVFMPVGSITMNAVTALYHKARKAQESKNPNSKKIEKETRKNKKKMLKLIKNPAAIKPKKGHN